MKRAERIMNQLGLKGFSTIKEVNVVAEPPLIPKVEEKIEEIIDEEMPIKKTKSKKDNNG
jgi:hypothetical protein